jgi:magnesium transporter
MTEIVDEELGDDYAKLAALSSEEEKDETLFKSMKKRIPWLVALLFLGLGVSAVVGLFEGVVDELPMIVAFQSMILGMAGNVGTQSLAVTVRALGNDDDFGLGQQLKIIFKEFRVACLNGLALGLFSFVIVGAYLLVLGHYAMPIALTTAGCVSLALWFAMMISGFTGAAIPLLFYRLKIDPAVASGPLITTINDLVAVVSYYGLAWVPLM